MNSCQVRECLLTVMRLMAQVDTVATTLTLAEQNHAEELKRVCLEFASRNLSTVMCSEGYHHMISSCPQLQVLTWYYQSHVVLPSALPRQSFVRKPNCQHRMRS